MHGKADIGPLSGAKLSGICQRTTDGFEPEWNSSGFLAAADGDNTSDLFASLTSILRNSLMLAACRTNLDYQKTS